MAGSSIGFSWACRNASDRGHAAVAFFTVFIVSIAADKAIDKFRQCITIQSLKSKILMRSGRWQTTRHYRESGIRNKEQGGNLRETNSICHCLFLVDKL